MKILAFLQVQKHMKKGKKKEKKVFVKLYKMLPFNNLIKMS